MEIALLFQQSYKLMGSVKESSLNKEDFIQSETLTESGDFKSILIVHLYRFILAMSSGTSN